MFSYSGPARLVYANGSTAELDRVDMIETVTDGLWQFSGAGTAAEALDAGAARIKLVTGGQADVLVSNVRISEGVRGVSCSVTLIGSERPPSAA
ncbi:hypothetical protein SAMN05216188_115196 [Lentzea xinjiangensis]|uniref:Uncharacterized protein n=1 Tax=Lentzea xinjiangensis TaxID=402600 RepID=A0A1H9S420_9PSEU|nr:hypothetical protein [Lentzea xinjiangensis]SER78889.1 hypothetical protein SAMN05216188_115196 [Lentzea xinjiangensis]